MKNVGVLLFFLFSLYIPSFCQDSLEIKEDIDTIILKKEPYILKKTVYISPKGRKKIYRETWLEFAGSPFHQFNRYASCDCLEDYFHEVKSSTRPITGYFINLSALQFFNNFVLSPGVNYFNYREKFHYISPNKEAEIINQYKYLGLQLLIGYRLINNYNFQFIPSIGITGTRLLTIKGKTLSTDFPFQIENISAIRQYYAHNYQLTAKYKFVYTSYSNKIYLAIEPNFNIDIRSPIKKTEPFVLQRITAGISGNLIIKINK